MGWPKPPKPWLSPAAAIFWGDGGASTGAGLRNYASELENRGYDARQFKYTDWKYAADQLIRFLPARIVIVGFSFGGDAAIQCATRCDLPISLMWLLEPTKPPYPAKNPNTLPPKVIRTWETYCVPQTPLTANQGPRVTGANATSQAIGPPANHLNLHSNPALLAQFLEEIDGLP